MKRSRPHDTNNARIIFVACTANETRRFSLLRCCIENFIYNYVSTSQSTAIKRMLLPYTE